MELSISKSMLGADNARVLVDVSIDGDVIATIVMRNSAGNLEYDIVDQADLDGVFTIHNICSEYFGGE